MSISLTDINGVVINGDSTPNALRMTSYTSDGLSLYHNDRSAITPSTSIGIISAASDYKQSRFIRTSSEGILRGGSDTLLFYDGTNTTTIDTNVWTQTLSTMTQTLAASIGRIFNASNATTGGAMNASNKFFQISNFTSLVYKSRVKIQAHATYNIIELGFCTPPATASTQGLTNGVVWRKDLDGNWLPVIIMNSIEYYGTPITNQYFVSLVPVNNYATFSVLLDGFRATFKITTSTGVIVNEQVINFTSKLGYFTVGHLQIMERVYQSTALEANATSPSMMIIRTSVWMLDTKGYTSKQSFVGMNHSTTVIPTTYLQYANYTDGSAPASATLSNTAASYTTLGGQWQFAAVAGAETDYAFFSLQPPTPFMMIITRVSISAYNTGAANAAGLTVLQWGIGINALTANLSTIANPRQVIGIHVFDNAAAIGASGGPDVVWEGLQTNSRTTSFHIILKIPIGTATTNQIIRGTCTIEGYLE